MKKVVKDRDEGLNGSSYSLDCKKLNKGRKKSLSETLSEQKIFGLT